MPTEPILLRIYHDLLAHFGPQHWWPGDTPFEIAVGAILTQNTNWGNVELAIARLKQARMLVADAIAEAPPRELAERIRPAGTHNVKTRRLQALAQWWRRHARAGTAPAWPTPRLRDALLAIHGVGEETADCILLYAFARRSFVVDAYTRRFLARHHLAEAKEPYTAIQRRFAEQLPADVVLYKEYHALIVALGKASCRPRPLCGQCPLQWHLPAQPMHADFTDRK